MAEDCHAMVRGCPCCQAFEGEVHLDYTSIESTMELNKPPHGEKCPGDDRPFHEVCPCSGYKGLDGQDSHQGVL